MRSEICLAIPFSINFFGIVAENGYSVRIVRKASRRTHRKK